MKMRNTLSRLITFSIFTSLLFIAIFHSPVLADAKSEIQKGVNTAAGTNNTPNVSGLNSTIAAGLNIFSAVVGVVAVIMIIVAGFRYITSGGNDTAIAESKKTIIYAL